jgi:hypothetical protein
MVIILDPTKESILLQQKTLPVHLDDTWIYLAFLQINQHYVS